MAGDGSLRATCSSAAASTYRAASPCPESPRADRASHSGNNNTVSVPNVANAVNQIALLGCHHRLGSHHSGHRKRLRSPLKLQGKGGAEVDIGTNYDDYLKITGAAQGVKNVTIGAAGLDPTSTSN